MSVPIAHRYACGYVGRVVLLCYTQYTNPLTAELVPGGNVFHVSAPTLEGLVAFMRDRPMEEALVYRSAGPRPSVAAEMFAARWCADLRAGQLSPMDEHYLFRIARGARGAPLITDERLSYWARQRINNARRSRLCTA